MRAQVVEAAELAAGWVERPAAVAAGMLVVARCARTHFHDPAWRSKVKDPVVTTESETVRFESLSGCAGVLARLELEWTGPVRDGRTNVDFNAAMRAALARVTDASPMHLRVGEDAIEVLTAEGGVVEGRVPLPARWRRGFAEAAVAERGVAGRLRFDAPSAVRLVREAARARGDGTWHVLPAGRLGRTARPGAVGCGGVERLRLLEPLVPVVAGLTVGGAPSGATAWTAALPGARLTLVLSPARRRGFTGEGGVPGDSPRAAGARRLVEAGAVRADIDGRWWVRASGGAEHRVRLDPDACTCPWWSRHPGDRGPCKHVLAARMAAGG